jgi:hypothetical protein
MREQQTVLGNDRILAPQNTAEHINLISQTSRNACWRNLIVDYTLEIEDDIPVVPYWSPGLEKFCLRKQNEIIENLAVKSRRVGKATFQRHDTKRGIAVVGVEFSDLAGSRNSKMRDVTRQPNFLNRHLENIIIALFQKVIGCLSIFNSDLGIFSVMFIKFLLDLERVRHHSTLVGVNIEIVQRRSSSQMPSIYHFVKGYGYIHVYIESIRRSIDNPILVSNDETVTSSLWLALWSQTMVIRGILYQNYVRIEYWPRQLYRKAVVSYIGNNIVTCLESCQIVVKNDWIFF